MMEWARAGAIVLFGLFALSGIVTLIHPGYDEMMRRAMSYMPSWYRMPPASQMPGPMWIFGLFGTVLLAVPLYFLVRRRPAFARPMV